MNKIKALLFDLDGTLIDSESFHFDCWNAFLSDYNVSLTFTDWIANYSGIPMPVNAQTILRKYKLETTLEEIIAKREKLTMDRLNTIDIKLMPYVTEFLEFFYRKGLIMAIVTASPTNVLEVILKRNGLAKYFNTYVTRTDVQKSKPDPESYNLCIEKIQVAKSDCIVFEDTINGVKAAVAANITCFAIQNNIREHQKLKVADQLFLNFEHAKNHIIQNHLID